MYICNDCGNRFETPLTGVRAGGRVLNGCPECGCGQYAEEIITGPSIDFNFSKFGARQSISIEFAPPEETNRQHDDPECAKWLIDQNNSYRLKTLETKLKDIFARLGAIEQQMKKGQNEPRNPK